MHYYNLFVHFYFVKTVHSYFIIHILHFLKINNEEELIDYDFMKKYIILQEIKSIEQFIHKYSEN